MRRLLNENGRARQFTSAIFCHIALSLLVQYLFLRSSHGLHLSKTISYTALNLAKEAGMEEEDISAAAMLSGGEDLDGENEEARQLEQADIPPITDSLQSFGGPVLPLCCSRESDDMIYYQCGGSSVSKENLNDNNNGIQRSWTAPPTLVSTKAATEFRLEKSVLSCHYAAFSASLSLSENSTDGHHFYPDGNLKFENEFYRINEYCISSIRKDKISLQICQANCSDPLTPCIQKCCGLDEVYSFGSDDYPTGCQPIARGGGVDSTSASGESHQSIIKWTPHLYHDLNRKLTSYEVSQLTPHYIQRYPSNFKNKCKSKKTTVFPFGMGVADYLTMVTGKPFKNLEFRLRKDGWLLYPFRDSKGNEIPVINRILNYCVDGAQAYGELSDYMNVEEQTVLFLCSGGVDEGKKIKKKRKRKKNKNRKISTSIPLIMRTDFARTTTYSNSSGLYTTLTEYDEQPAKLPQTYLPTSTMKASSSMTTATAAATTTSSTTIVPISPTFSLQTPTTTNTLPSTTTSTTTTSTTTTTTSTTPPPTIRTQAQERKVFTLFSSARNKSFYNKIMSGSSNNNASSNNQISLNEISSTTAASSSIFTTKKSRFRKRSRHYIFYKPIAVHSLLRNSNGEYYYT